MEGIIERKKKKGRKEGRKGSEVFKNSASEWIKNATFHPRFDRVCYVLCKSVALIVIKIVA